MNDIDGIGIMFGSNPDDGKIGEYVESEGVEESVEVEVVEEGVGAEDEEECVGGGRRENAQVGLLQQDVLHRQVLSCAPRPT